MWTSDSRLGGLQKPQFKAVLVTVSRIFCRIFFKTNQVNALSLIKTWICFRDIPQVWHHAPKPKIVKVLSPISPIMNFLNAHIYEQQPKICFRSRKRFISVSSSSQPTRSFILAKNRGRVSPSFFQANQVGHIWWHKNIHYSPHSPILTPQFSFYHLA